MSDDIDDLLNEASKGPEGDEKTPPVFPGNEEQAQGTIKMEYKGDQELQEAKIAAQHRLSQSDAFILLVAVDEVGQNKGIGYEWISNYGSRASSHFVTEFMHQAIIAATNVLTTIDQAVQKTLQTALMSKGRIPHPMDSAKTIVKNVMTGGVSVVPTDDQNPK